MKFGSVRSEPHALDCGVPQGSVLGPIIFNMYTTPLERIIHRHNLCYHKYADDMEIYGEYDPSSNCDCLRIRHQMEVCLDEIRAWMPINMLKINDNKTEMIVFMNPQLAKSLQEAGTPKPSIVLCNNTITTESAIRNLNKSLQLPPK